MDQLPRKFEDTDFSEREIQRIVEFEQNGLQGVSKLSDEQYKLAYKMYLEGCSYDIISNRFHIKKDVILYRAWKDQWYSAKKAKLLELSESIVDRINIAKADSVSFLVDLVQFSHEYYKDKIDQYRKTKDDRIVETLDMKQLEKYFKTIEMLDKLTKVGEGAEGKDSKTPLVNVIFNGIASVSREGNTMSVTPDKKEELTEEALLKQIAELERKKE
jgi:hypothetical protein